MKIQWKQEGKNMALLLVGALIYGIGTHAFVEPAHIAPGGAMGIALMVNHFADLPIGLLTLAINIPLLVLAWFSNGIHTPPSPRLVFLTELSILSARSCASRTLPRYQ